MSEHLAIAAVALAVLLDLTARSRHKCTVVIAALLFIAVVSQVTPGLPW